LHVCQNEKSETEIFQMLEGAADAYNLKCVFRSRFHAAADNIDVPHWNEIDFLGIPCTYRLQGLVTHFR